MLFDKKYSKTCTMYTFSIYLAAKFKTYNIMKEKLIKAIKEKYSNLGFSAEAIDLLADSLSKQITEESEIENQISSLEPTLKVFQSILDKQRGEQKKLQTEKEKLSKEVEKWKKEAEQAKEEVKPEPEPEPEPEKKVETKETTPKKKEIVVPQQPEKIAPEPKQEVKDEMPEWAKIFAKQTAELQKQAIENAKTVKALQSELQKQAEVLEHERSAKIAAQRSQEITSIINQLPETLRKGWTRIDVAKMSDDEFTALKAEITNEVGEAVKELTAKGAAFNPPQGGELPQGEETIDKNLIDGIAAKLVQNI